MFLKKIKAKINELEAQCNWTEGQFDKRITCDNCGGLFLKNKLIEQDEPKVRYYKKEYQHTFYQPESVYSSYWSEINKEEYKKEKDEEVRREFERQLFCKHCNQN